MAATKRNRTHPDDPAHVRTRAKIQATQLVKRLQCYALEEKDEAGHDVDLDSGRIRAIEILLSKTLPSLTATQLSGDENNPVAITAVTRTIIPAKKSK